MRKFILILLTSFCLVLPAGACAWCRPRVRAGIYTPAYAAQAGLVLLPLVVLLALGLGMFYWDKLRPARLPHHAGR